jgi:hypothetical protein
VAASQVDVAGKNRAEQAAEKRKATLSDRQNAPRLGKTAHEIVLEHEVQTGAGDRPNHEPDKQAIDLFTGNAVCKPSGVPAR